MELFYRLGRLDEISLRLDFEIIVEIVDVVVTGSYFWCITDMQNKQIIFLN